MSGRQWIKLQWLVRCVCEACHRQRQPHPCGLCTGVHACSMLHSSPVRCKILACVTRMPSVTCVVRGPLQVGGLAQYVRALKEMVFLPLVYPELFARFHVQPPRGGWWVLLCCIGPACLLLMGLVLPCAALMLQASLVDGCLPGLIPVGLYSTSTC